MFKMNMCIVLFIACLGVAATAETPSYDEALKTFETDVLAQVDSTPSTVLSADDSDDAEDLQGKVSETAASLAKMKVMNNGRWLAARKRKSGGYKGDFDYTEAIKDVAGAKKQLRREPPNTKKAHKYYAEAQAHWLRARDVYEKKIKRAAQLKIIAEKRAKKAKMMRERNAKHKVHRAKVERASKAAERAKKAAERANKAAAALKRAREKAKKVLKKAREGRRKNK
jgi:hypothetical protein